MIEKCKKALDDLNNEIHKDKIETSINYSLNDFIQTSKNFLTNLQKTFDKIGKDLNEKTDSKQDEFNKINLNFINELKQLETFLINSKNKLETSKYEYFDASKIRYEQEEKFNKFLDSQINQNIANNTFSQLIKAQKNCEKITENYKSNIVNMNTTLLNSENTYNQIINLLKTQEEVRILFISNLLKDFNEILRDHSNNEKNYITQIDKIITNINVKIDIKKYEKFMSFTDDKGNRFEKEQFLDYEIYRKNLSENSSNNSSNTNNKVLNSLLLNVNDKIFGFSSGAHYDNFEVRKLQLKEIKENNRKLSLIFEKLILNESPLETDNLMYVINLIEGNAKNSIIVMKELSHYYEVNIIVTLSCIENLHHLSNILLIIMNNVQLFNEIFDLNYVVIYIAEKTIYRDPENFDNKFYLCDLISNNKMFSFNNFWNQCIDKKIITISEVKVKNEIEKRKKEEVKHKNNQDMISKVKNIFNTNMFNNNYQNQENKKIEDKIIYGKIYEQKLPFIAVEVLEDYIKHFLNFNYNIEEGTEIIINIGKKYNIDNKYINYFKTELYSNYYSRKANKKKLNGKSYYYFKIKKNKKLSSMNIQLLNIIKFLPIKEITPLLCLNKETYNFMKKYIYKNILLNYHDLDIKTHIKIWKILLNFSEMKKKYNYQKIKEEIKKNPDCVPAGDIIDLDILRTCFEKDKDENREKIKYILKAISKESNNISYCQGMNYVASFLISFINDEEEIFYLFISLIYNTNYGELFLNDFEKLKKYFYFFERLLQIYLPELYLYFMNSNINVSFFISSWFITIFTNSFTEQNYGKKPKILMRIWDLLSIKGTKSFLTTAISLIKYYESKLLSLNFEKLLRYLITDILISEFFNNDNFDKAFKIIMDFKLSNELIDSLEKEYEIKLKLPQTKI